MSFDEAFLKTYGLRGSEVSDLMPKVPSENVISHRLLEKDYFCFFCHQSMEEFLAACLHHCRNETQVVQIIHEAPVQKWLLVRSHQISFRYFIEFSDST